MSDNKEAVELSLLAPRPIPSAPAFGTSFVVGPLVLERPEEAFHDGVVIAAAGATHRALDAERLQRVLIGVAGVLAAAIAVVCSWAPWGRRDSMACAAQKPRGRWPASGSEP